jgi:hypothetical protein
VRGCVTIILLAIVFVAAVGWLAGPPAAGVVIQAGLTAGGLQASDLEVTVDSDPNWEVLTGRADRVRINGAQATLRGTSIEHLELELRDVVILDRRAAIVSGQLDGVVVGEGTARGLRVERISLGGGDPVTAIAEVDEHLVTTLIFAGLDARLGQRPDEVTLVPPDRLVIRLGQTVLDGDLRVQAGALVLRIPGPAGAAIGDLVLLDAGALPLELDTVAVRDGRLVLGGTLDPGLFGAG